MTVKKQWLLASVLATAVLAGCGGGDSSPVYTQPPPTPPAQSISDTVSVLVQYVQQLIAATDETSEPIDINGLKLVTDDTAEPSAI
jgi:hypothetical protein